MTKTQKKALKKITSKSFSKVIKKLEQIDEAQNEIYALVDDLVYEIEDALNNEDAE